MIAKLEGTCSNVQQNIDQTDSHNGSNNKQQVNNNIITALERTAAKFRTIHPVITVISIGHKLGGNNKKKKKYG